MGFDATLSSGTGMRVGGVIGKDGGSTLGSVAVTVGRGRGVGGDEARRRIWATWMKALVMGEPKARGDAFVRLECRRVSMSSAVCLR